MIKIYHNLDNDFLKFLLIHNIMINFLEKLCQQQLET